MKTQSITSLPPSPTEDRRARMIKYTVAMAVRVGCIVGLLFVSGWWLLVCALGAIALPYFAVIIANVSRALPKTAVLRPGTLVRETSGSSRDDEASS